MARRLYKFEQAKKAAREKEEKREEDQIRKKFVKDFVSKTSEEQAGIIFDLLNRLEKKIDSHYHLENAKF